MILNSYPKTVILRHRKENLKKCSLSGLESHPDFDFFSYPKETPRLIGNYFLLTIDAPVLTESDRDLGLFLIDGTWKLAMKMEKNLSPSLSFIKRSLPTHYQTAYPRAQTGCLDPSRGLASIEALYLALHILKRPCDFLLNGYHFKEQFLKKNNLLF